MIRLYFLLALFLVGSVAYSQKSPSKFGEIDKKNLEMKVYPADTSAGAIVLMDWGYVNFDHNFEVQLERHVRIKIFNSTRFDLADVEIPHYRKDMVERLKASTFNLEDGKIVEYEVEKGEIIDENFSEYIKKKKFSLKNVRDGSIIEYTYRVNYGSYSRIMPWYFQREIPVVHSEYYVELPEIFEYKRILKGYLPLQAADISKKNTMYQGSPITLTTQHYVAKNVPAFVEEPFLTTKDDFISSIAFELYAIVVPGSTYQRYMPDNYGELSWNLARDEDFGKRMERGRFLKEETEKVVAGLTTEEEKARAIYKFVQDVFEVDYDFDEENYKKIFDARRGYARDINFILIMMLKEAGIDTEPVIISTRENGYVHPAYPSSKHFNYILALASIGDESYLLDASDKYLEFNSIGSKCLNGRGLVISEANPRWIDLKPTLTNMKMTVAQCVITPEGNVEAALKIDRQGYIAMNFRKNRNDKDDDYKEEFKGKHSSWSIEEHSITGLEKDAELVETLSIRTEEIAEMLGDHIYIKPIFIDGLDSNPFKLQERTYPVNYGAPVREVMSYTFTMPEGFEVDELPQPVAVALPDNAGKFLYSVSVNANLIMVTSQFLINKVEFSVEEYPYLRAFYAQVVAKQAEQIVLKKKI